MDTRVVDATAEDAGAVETRAAISQNVDTRAAKK